jgi:hypothetical protein
MGILSNEIDRRPSPVERYQDNRLGVMTFDEDDETWVGRFNGYEYRISYQDYAIPQRDLLAYCIEIFNRNAWLEVTLDEHKRQFIRNTDGLYQAEIEQLEYLSFMFYRGGDQLRILAQLTGKGLADTDTERMWRIMFCGDKCQSMTFDC